MTSSWGEPIKKVHQFAKNILNLPESTPNSLHRNLLSLFSYSEKIHLVTTNFDSHLTTAGEKVCKEPNGIVYLHGSVEKDPSQMVITDLGGTFSNGKP